MLPKLSAANSQDSFVSKYLSPATRIQSSFGCATQKTPTKKIFYDQFNLSRVKYTR